MKSIVNDLDTMIVDSLILASRVFIHILCRIQFLILKVCICNHLLLYTLILAKSLALYKHLQVIYKYILL